MGWKPIMNLSNSRLRRLHSRKNGDDATKMCTREDAETTIVATNMAQESRRDGYITRMV